MKKVIVLLAFIALGFSFTAVEAQTGTVYAMPYTCGFETTDLALLGWTTIDYNNDGHTWTTNGPQNITPHSGSGLVASASYISGATGDIAPDNFLVSPRIAVTGDAVLSWWYRVGNSLYPADHYSVYISTAGNTATDFLATTPVFDYTPTSENYPIWNQEVLNLSAYAGDTIYIAFRHHNCFGQYAILLDDVEIAPLSSPWSVADTMPWSTTFDTPDTGWTFIGRKNGWYIGAQGALSGSGGMYVSGDGGATNSCDRVAAWDSRFHWAARPLHFTDSGEFRVDYDWKCDGYFQCYTYNNHTTCTYYDYVRVMLAPVSAELDTAEFFGYGITTYSNNLLPTNWISLSDTNGMRLLANEADWTHHAQIFHVPTAGDYLLLVLATSSPTSSVYHNTIPAIDNFSLSNLTCPNSIDTLRLTANSNQGLTVNWHDSQASQWAVYLNGSLQGTTADTSFYLADASLSAATCNNTLGPRIAVSSICSAGDTALPANIVGKWSSHPDFSSTVSCRPFSLPYSENFDAYLDNDNEFFGWYYLGGIVQYTENQQSHSAPMSLKMRALNLPNAQSQIFVSPQMDAPGNSLTVSFWAKLPTYIGADTDTIFQAGVLFDRDTMDYAHVSQNNTPIITLRGSDADGLWHQFLFTTQDLDSTSASITFSLAPHSSSWYECYIDDIEVSLLMDDSVPPTVAISGPTSAIADVDTVLFSATLLNGDTTGLSYSWHSALMDSTIVTMEPLFSIRYTTIGTDTITLIATNAFGSDTATHIVTVSDNLYVSIMGTSIAYVGDTLHYTANLSGVTTGLTYSWHSTMLDSTIVTSVSMVTIVYTATGTDTLTLTVVNTHGPHIATRIITVQSCNVITNFPYTEDFEGYQSQDRLACWIIRTPVGRLDNEWRRSNGGNDDGGYYCMYSNGNGTNQPFEAWLITPAIELPFNADSITFGVVVNARYNHRFSILASPTGDPYYDEFTDTLYNLVSHTEYATPWDTLLFSLDAYRGHHIRIAFVHSSDNGGLNTVRIDDISIIVDTSAVIPIDTVWYTVNVNVNDPVAGTASGDGTYAYGDTATLTATAYEGYHFEGWRITPGYQNIVTENPITLIVTEDMSIVAYFAADSTGIDDILPSNIKVYSIEGRIVIEGADGEDIRIYDMMGCQICAKPFCQSHRPATAPSRNIVELTLNTGIYLVRIGTYPARKVVVIR